MGAMPGSAEREENSAVDVEQESCDSRGSDCHQIRPSFIPDENHRILIKLLCIKKFLFCNFKIPERSEASLNLFVISFIAVCS